MNNENSCLKSRQIAYVVDQCNSSQVSVMSQRYVPWKHNLKNYSDSIPATPPKKEKKMHSLV